MVQNYLFYYMNKRDHNHTEQVIIKSLQWQSFLLKRTNKNKCINHKDMWLKAIIPEDYRMDFASSIFGFSIPVSVLVL